MRYDTGNSVPSIDPRDLDDNAQVLDALVTGTALQVSDRLGNPRKSWAAMELAAQALVSPNVAGLAAVAAGQYKISMFTSSDGSQQAIDSGALGRTLLALANTAAGQAAGRAALGAISAADNITGSAAKLTTARTLAMTGDGTWSAAFDGSANVTGALTLADTGVAAGTYTRVTVDSKGRVTAGQSSALAISNGGTGATAAAAARTNLGVLAQTDKPAWTTYTPTVTAGSGTYTNATASGKYVVEFGICYFSILVTLTTRGTGTLPIVTLPVTGLAGLAQFVNPAFNSSNNKAGSARCINTTQLQIFAVDGTDLATADGHQIIVSGSYPVA